MFPESKVMEEPLLETHIPRTEASKARVEGPLAMSPERQQASPSPELVSGKILKIQPCLDAADHPARQHILGTYVFFQSFFQTRVAALTTCQALASRNFFLTPFCGYETEMFQVVKDLKAAQSSSIPAGQRRGWVWKYFPAPQTWGEGDSKCQFQS